MVFFGRIALASLALVGCFANARYLPQRDSVVNKWPQSFADLQPRTSNENGRPSCRPICGSCGSSCSSTEASKRSLLQLITSNSTNEDILSDTDHDNTSHLLKRQLKDVRQAAISSYLKSKVNALVTTRDNPNTNLIDLAYSTGFNDYTFATLREFSNFGTDVLNIGTQGLHGCTVLTVVSKRAVYMGHFFESLAFSVDGGKAPDTAFEQNCLNLITGQGQRWRARGDSINPSLFTGDNGPAIAYIMTPRRDQDTPTPQNPNPPVPGPDTQLFAGRIEQLSQTLTDLIPGLGITYYNYIGMNVKQQSVGYKGKALFEFDPNADGSNNPNFRLWYEHTMVDGREAGLIV
ncbi:hypothetical protein F5Y09DRAFT_341512 [Xylaria sp. FL1042]|nr:hypothetical protein F5Y09DRAFT_341512 [Xylaria sp. FL1042]